MAQLSDDCFAFGGPLLTLAEMRALLVERVAPAAAIERVGLAAADNRVLAADLVAPIDLPPFDNSAVDGYAVRHADLAAAGGTELAVAGRLAAGAAAPAAPAGRVALRIFTGAPMPAGFDTVFMQEDAQERDGRVILPPGLKPGANRRLAGEDVGRGTLALTAGRRLTPDAVALSAAFGLESVAVRAPLRVALFSTGDEIVAPGKPLGEAALYDANRFLLAALLRRLGCSVTDLGILEDRRENVAEALQAAAGGHDLIVTSGGVSTGEEDHVKGAVESVGTLTFWRVAIKPGRPVAMGVVGGAPFIGLPGNPVAVFVTFVQVARPLIARLSGEIFEPPEPLPVAAGFSYRKKEGRREYVRVRLRRDAEGRVLAQKHPREGAGVITSLTETDGLVELAEEATRIERGETVGFLPYASLV
jgi:molybdopterin molybdotransferase